MNRKKYDIIAVDIAKETLQVQTPQQSFGITNNKTGFAELLKRSAHLNNAMVVCEASGGYERALMAFLFSKSIAVALVNPRRVRAFAISEGIKAKTDPIDARVILSFAQEKKLIPMPAPDPKVQRMGDLLDRRTHLCDQLAQEKNRLQNCSPAIAKYIRKMIRFVQKELDVIQKDIRMLVRSDALLKEQDRTLQSVTGVGEVSSWTVLAQLGEINHLSRNKIVALAGLAPFNRDSGTFTGKRTIQGGRAKVRSCLYMAALSAASHNPVIKAYTDRLKARGKPHKWVMVAAMRKLLIHLQSLLRNQQFALAS